MPDESNLNDATTLQSSMDEAYAQLQQTNSDLQEIEILIEKNASELERLAQRDAQVAGYVRKFQEHLDAVPSEVLCEGYEALLNSRQRLVALRGQMEKLQSDRRHLERLAEAQSRFLQLSVGRETVSDAPQQTDVESTNIAKSVVRIIEDEESIRESLANRLHDGPISSLSNLILQAEICQRLFDVSPERARSELATLKEGATLTFGAVRSALLDIRPMMLADLGLAPALRHYVESWQEEDDISIRLTIVGEERRLASHVETVVFRGIQEFLHNARVHGEATRAQLRLDMAADRVVAIVEDNGLGFVVDNTEDTPASIERGKSGLVTLKERVEVMAGELEIQSNPGQGTRAQLSIPVAE